MLLRIGAVKAETGERSNSSVYANIREGLFPKPVRIGKRAVGWPEDEVKAVCIARIAGKPEDEIQELVRFLVDRRDRDYKVSIATLRSEFDPGKLRQISRSPIINKVATATPLLGGKA